MQRRGTVLVVDDEEGVRASVRAILEETCEVLEAENRRVSLRGVAAHDVELVMMDQRMPGEAGVDCAAAREGTRSVRVVVLATAYAICARRWRRSSAAPTIPQPAIDVDDILGLADRALEKRALERARCCVCARC